MGFIYLNWPRWFVKLQEDKWPSKITNGIEKRQKEKENIFSPPMELSSSFSIFILFGLEIDLIF